MPFRIIIADDHPIVRKGIRETLQKESDFDITAEFEDGKSLVHSVELSVADLLLLDLNLPRIDGLAVLREINDRNLKVRVVVFTAYISQKLSDECRELGCAAYLVKTEDLSGISDLIKRVLAGENLFEDVPPAASSLEDRFSYFDDFLVKFKLTKREVEIILLISKGFTSSEIADQLSVSPFTVLTHRKNILKKLALDPSNNVGLLNFASKNGIIP